MVEMLSALVPQFSAMLLRGRLVDLFKSQSPPLTLICAAAGYGKTVLAAQMAQYADFDVVVWVQLPDADVAGDFLLRQVADSLDGGSCGDDDLISEGVRPLGSTAFDSLVRIRNRLEDYRESRVLLIVDGANGLSDIPHLVKLASDLSWHTSAHSRLVVSCRRIEDDHAFDPGAVWLLEEGDLAFTMHEVFALVSDVESADLNGDARRLYMSCSGHPAITRIMLRHGLTESEVRPRDLTWQTEKIVSRLDETSIAALYLASVLCGGELLALQRCALACDLGVDWLALSRTVPLFHVVDSAASGRSFRVHTVLCDVADRIARSKVSEEDRRNIRAIAFEQLVHDREYLRLAFSLEHRGDEGEIAEWCDRQGVPLIRHAGHTQVAQLLARLSPLTIASSARLLLLRAHVQRAVISVSAALESATMAKRVAEVTRDKEMMVAATLFIARLQFDQGLIAESRGILEEIEAYCRTNGDLAAQCLTQAYLAVCDGQAGRLHDANERIGTLTKIARLLDQGSDEAVFVANCVGAVACQCTGDWDVAAAVLAPIAQRKDVAAQQQAHIGSNHAVALFELGDCRAAQERIQTVLTVCTDLGITAVYPYATAALSDVLYAVGDTSGGLEADARAVESFECSADYFGLASHRINSARALRALGNYEESLACALSAESLLAGNGPSAHMLHLMASIETAASHLALGNVARSARVIAHVATDPAVAEARGHLLRCDLIRAATDLGSGDWAAAVERLAGHAEYIANGSANVTLACYIRAFPGLLGVLDQALGEAGVPSRVSSLLPPATITDSLIRIAHLAGSEVAAAMRCKYVAAESVDETRALEACADEPHDPFLRVRTLGKVEIESTYGHVEHQHWRKRKARLLFLMLLCAPAHEIPRDVILERLWPDMDRTNAQRNLYVTWSHLRKALTCETPDADVGQFAGSNSDACWLTGVLECDLDLFRAELRSLNAAHAAGDHADVLASATRLARLYQGELLPMDIYEEWFEEDRTRTRGDFCDAMVTGAYAAVALLQPSVALVLLKRVSAIDPWREDVYQLTMSCQMSVGQRSGAIETYNRCRTRLVDDLGIDPCAETVRVFQAVLAMEDSGSHDVSVAGC